MYLLSNQMDDWFDEIRRMREQIDKILEPHLRLHEQLESISATYRILQEQIEELLEPQLQFKKHIEKILIPQQQMMEQIWKFSDTQQKIHQLFEEWIEPKRQLYDQMEKIRQSLSHFYNLSPPISEIISSFKGIGVSHSEIHRTIQNLLGNISQDDIQIEKSGILSVSGEIVTEQELNKVFKDLIAQLQKIPSPIEVYELIASILKKLKKPLAILILVIIIPYIINITANLSTPYLKDLLSEFSHKSKRDKIKAIKKEANETFDLNTLSEFRFVVANTLNVRKSSSTSAAILDKLSFGQVVRILKRGRKWSYVQYTNEKGDEVQGWVFNRYLANFKK